MKKPLAESFGALEGRRAVLALILLAGCRVPREVHRQLPYPDAKVRAKRLLVRRQNTQTEFLSETGKSFSVPQKFFVQAESRLWQVAGERGPDLEVLVSVVRVDEVQLVDARGEISRLEVELEITVQPVGGKALTRGTVESNSDIPRGEGTQQELQFLVLSTALNAFDRFWASEQTVGKINRAMESLGTTRR